MRAISLRQPWPWFVLNAGKDVENRFWTSAYRGPVLVHSSRWWDQEEIGDDLDLASRIAGRAGTMPASGPPSLEALGRQRGAIVGIARIVGSTTDDPSPWFFGPKAFRLADQAPFDKPVPCRGERGLFTPPPEVVARCLEQIPGGRG